MPYRQEHFSRELMKTGLLFLRNGKIKKSVYDNNYDPFRSLIVYCIKQVKPGLWLPLNRDYNILGLIKGEWSDYSSDLYNHMLLKTEEINFDFLWDNDTERKEGDSNNFFTYSDGTSPCYYQSSKIHFLKNLYRYEEILRICFFCESTDKKFIDFWGYKNNSTYEKYYRKNVDRLINA